MGCTYDEDKEDFEKIINRENFKMNPIKFSFNNNQIIACCDVDFSQYVDKNIINRIVIGPKSRLTEYDVCLFLMSNGFDCDKIEISKSQATYR